MKKAKRKARTWWCIVRKRNRGGYLVYDFYRDLETAKDILAMHWKCNWYKIIKIREVLPKKK